MKKRKKLLIVSAFSCIMLVLSVGATSANWDVLQDYLASDEENFESKISSMTINELIDQIDTIAAGFGSSATLTSNNLSDRSNNINVLIPFVSELIMKKEQIDDSDILQLIQDKNKTLILRETLVDLYTLKHNDDQSGNEIKQFLKHEDVDYSIKTKIVASAKMTENDIDLLKDMVSEDDGLLAFHSLKRISRIDRIEAYRISEGILSNIENESTNKVSAALKATAKYLSYNNQHQKDASYQIQNEKDFLELCLNFIKQSDDTILKDSAFFAISELRSREAISMIINSDVIDKQLKPYAINQNFNILQEILTNDPTEDEIKLVVKAMELHPIIEVVEQLESLIPTVSDEELKQRIDSVITFAKKEGVKGNNKWILD